MASRRAALLLLCAVALAGCKKDEPPPPRPDPPGGGPPAEGRARPQPSPPPGAPARDAPKPCTAVSLRVPPDFRGSLSVRQLAGSGWPLNDVLEELQKRPGGATEPGPRLDAWALKRLNLIGKSGVDVGLIRRAGESWPATLRDYAYDRERRQVDTLLAKAVGQVREGKEPEAAVLEGLEESARALGTKLYWRGESTEPQNSEARFFLKSLEGAIQGLRDPEARRSLACAEELPAKVKTADALVRYLTEKKLRFGRAVGDDWRAYFVVYVHLEHYAAQLKARPKRK